MYTRLLDFCLVATMLRVGQASGNVNRLFSSLGRYGKTGTWQKHPFTAESLVACAVMCEKHGQCATFSFNKASRICYLSGGAFAGMFGLHTDKCPYDSGYLLYLQKKKITCLKYYPKVNQTNAAEKCYVDGAHLLTIDDKSMKKLVGDILKSNGWGDVWLDAFDTSNGKTLLGVTTGSQITEGSLEHCPSFVKNGSIVKDRCDEEHNALCRIYV